MSLAGWWFWTTTRAELVWDTVANVMPGFQNGTLDIVLKPGSKLSLLLNQEYVEQLNSVMTLRAYLEKDSELEVVTHFRRPIEPDGNRFTVCR